MDFNRFKDSAAIVAAILAPSVVAVMNLLICVVNAHIHVHINRVHVQTCSWASLFTALPISTFITVAHADHTSDLWVVT